MNKPVKDVVTWSSVLVLPVDAQRYWSDILQQNQNVWASSWKYLCHWKTHVSCIMAVNTVWNQTFPRESKREVWMSLGNKTSNVGFEVLTTVVMKSSVFWDITLCSLLKVNHCFRQTCHLHLQGWRISQARNQREVLLATYFMLVFCLACSMTLKMEWCVPPKRQFTFNGLHSIISHKAELFKISNICRWWKCLTQ
jgi:hypothetical protein